MLFIRKDWNGRSHRAWIMASLVIAIFLVVPLALAISKMGSQDIDFGKSSSCVCSLGQELKSVFDEQTCDPSARTTSPRWTMTDAGSAKLYLHNLDMTAPKIAGRVVEWLTGLALPFGGEAKGASAVTHEVWEAYNPTDTFRAAFSMVMELASFADEAIMPRLSCPTSVGCL